MKKWTRILCLALALLMLMAVPAFAETDDVEGAPADIVLLLDCSSSLSLNDPDRLCLEACKSFVDTLPASKEVRVSVIAFGYRGGESYTFQTQAMKEYSGDASLIHVLVPLSDLSKSEERENYKSVVEETVISKTNASGTFTPIATAVASAVDLLEANGTKSGDGCIILISDGVDSPMARLYDHNNASKQAGKNGYPIYGIELNYNNTKASQIAGAQKLMDEICSNSGEQDVGRITCETPTDVHVALQKIFCDFFELPWEDPIPVSKLPAEYSFTIPNLTSEATINIFGEGLDYVELVNVAEGTVQKVNKDVETERLIAVVEEGSYYSLKMIVPAEGEWLVKMYGDENGEAQVSLLVSNTAIQEMGLTMVANPSSSEAELIKSDTIRVDAFFEYRDIEVHNSEFYAQNPASVMVYCSNGTTKEFVMEADTNGYKLDMPLTDLPSGTSQLQVVLNHNMFRNGRKVSNVDSFKMKNLAMQLTGIEPQTFTAYVNSTFERIDLSTIFNNPDNDYVEYTLNCISDRSANFEFAVDADYMDIQSGLVPGTYEMEVGAKDPDMSSPMLYTMTLVVEDRLPEAKKLPKQKIWIDRYSWQKEEKMSASLNLDEYFTDPDGVQMTYTSAQDGAVVTVNQDGSVMELLPAEKGEAVITVTGTDGITEISAEMKVEVVSGKAVYWQQNWIFYVIGLAVLILIIVVIVILLKNKRVKGEWDVTIDENGDAYSLEHSMNIANYTRVGKKGTFLLKDLVSELILYIDNGSSLALVLPDYFAGTGAEKIELVGVFRRQGCTVNKIPKSGKVRVTCNGVEARGKASVYGGSLSFIIEKADDSGDRLTVTMFLRSGRS